MKLRYREVVYITNTMRGWWGWGDVENHYAHSNTTTLGTKIRIDDQVENIEQSSYRSFNARNKKQNNAAANQRSRPELINVNSSRKKIWNIFKNLHGTRMGAVRDRVYATEHANMVAGLASRRTCQTRRPYVATVQFRFFRRSRPASVALSFDVTSSAGTFPKYSTS